MAVIEIENVEVDYAGFRALNGVSCSIDGGTVGLLGPNGAGKSTLMKTLLGFNRASKGTVRIFGHLMPKEALKVRQNLGYMPEREVVSPKVSAVSFLTYSGRLFGMNRIDAMERTHEVLNYVGMGEARYRRMETYSTGMLQRVKLAQALLHDPKLLLLDEPTNGLDPDGRLEMLELIREVASQRGVTVIVSSHLLPDVQHVCEQLIMISGGRIVREGTLQSLTEDGLQRYEVTVRDSEAAFQEGLRAANLSFDVLRDGRMIVSGAALNGGRALFEIAQATGTQVRHFQPARKRLEEVFMDAVNESGAAPGQEA